MLCCSSEPTLAARGEQREVSEPLAGAQTHGPRLLLLGPPCPCPAAPGSPAARSLEAPCLEMERQQCVCAQISQISSSRAPWLVFKRSQETLCPPPLLDLPSASRLFVPWLRISPGSPARNAFPTPKPWPRVFPQLVFARSLLQPGGLSCGFLLSLGGSRDDAALAAHVDSPTCCGSTHGLLALCAMGGVWCANITAVLPSLRITPSWPGSPYPLAAGPIVLP